MNSISEILVIGRKKSLRVQGTGSNKVEKDRILLKSPFKQGNLSNKKIGYSINDNTCIFDLSILSSMNKSCCSKTKTSRFKVASEDTGGTVSCLQNHGGINCTSAFGVSSGNCVTKYDRCMDFNGWNTDCSGSHTYFLGSDCSRAMALGHCWNEVM